MERGYVRVWRRLTDSGLLQHPRALQLFMHLLLTATSKPCRRIVAGAPLELKPGDVVTGRERLAQELGATVREIRTAMDILKKMEIVTTKATNKYSVVSIINWDRYQYERPAERPAKQPAERPASDQQATTEQEVKNINTPITSLRSVIVPTGDTDTARKKAGSTIFKPPTEDEVRAYCQERGNAVDAGKFHDFYASKGWMVGKTKMKDWKAAVRTWEREAGKVEPQEDWAKLWGYKK